LEAPTVTTILFFILNFPLFYCYFLFRKAHISIFGSALLDPENSEQAVGNSEQPGWPRQGYEITLGKQ
jgi:hypothetical protein